MKKMVDGVEIELTPEEIAQRQDEEVRVLNEKKPLPILLGNLFDKLPAQSRAQFYIYRSAVAEAIRNRDFEAAKLIIEGVHVPQDIELVKQKMIEALNDG